MLSTPALRNRIPKIKNCFNNQLRVGQLWDLAVQHAAAHRRADLDLRSVSSTYGSRSCLHQRPTVLPALMSF